MNKNLLGYYDYTVVLTYAGMISSVIGIFCAMRGDFPAAMACLMISGICDAFDGTVARTKERTESEKRFGIQIDSLCDLISFGVLPGIIVYCLLESSLLGAVVSSMYILFALIRLAYFNVLEEERQDQTTEKRTMYLGLPVTTIALLLPLVYILFHMGILSNAVVFPVLLAVVGCFFIIPINVSKPHGLRVAAMAVFGLIELGITLFMLR